MRRKRKHKFFPSNDAYEPNCSNRKEGRKEKLEELLSSAYDVDLTHFCEADSVQVHYNANGRPIFCEEGKPQPLSLAKQVSKELAKNNAVGLKVKEGGKHVCVYEKPNCNKAYCYKKLSSNTIITIDEIVDSENSKSKYAKIWSVLTPDMSWNEEIQMSGMYISLGSYNLEIAE